MDAIQGRPEGREGIWLIDSETAVELIGGVEGDSVHNFIDSVGCFIGADWSKEEAVEFVRKSNQIALVFAPNLTARHQLVVLANKRYAFDVGEIAEDRMILNSKGESP